jgi:glutaredoxin
MTKDGLLLFPSAYELNQTITPPTPTPVKNITKTDKPVIELFVMSFCPYGIQAETAMKPVVDLLGTKADFKLRYIASVVGTTIDSVQSLHGINEAKEDLRQLCIAKYYDQATLWKYVSYIADGYPSNFSIGTIETKWKEAAAFASINVTKIEACLASESVGLMKLEEQTADGYGVSGSPTLIINGVKYSGSRTPDAYKQSICNAFTTIPAECSTALSTAGGTASGGC